MTSRSVQFMRNLLLVEVLLVVIIRVGGLETDVSVEELRFRLNKKFLFNRNPCRIPTEDIDFVFPKGVERVLSRHHIVDLQGSSKWLKAMGGKIESGLKLPRNVRTLEGMDTQAAKDEVNSIWLRKWRREFRKNQYDLIKRGEGMSSCIIWDTKERHNCCENYLDKQQEYGELREFKHKFCMGLVKTFVDTLLKMGVMLKQDDEERLEDELNRALATMAKERSYGKSSVALTPIYEVGIENVVPDDDRYPLTSEEKKRYEEEGKLLKFLVAMKQIEHVLLIGKERYVEDEQKAIYSTFMGAFQECMVSKKAAVSYHTAEIRWTTCAPVTDGDSVAGYCADLAAVDPRAPELSRKPILKWESGAYEQLHDLLDPNNIDTGDSEGDNDDSEGDNDDNSKSTTAGNQRNQKLRRRSARQGYTEVDLFAVALVQADSACNGVDLANSCYAMCCDSGYKLSYYCRTAGLRCIG